MLRGFLKKLAERDRARRSKLKELLSRAEGMKVAVILFGSRAKGEGSLSSDFDLLLVGDDAQRFKEMLIDLAIPADVHAFSLRSALEEMPSSSLLLDAFQEGILLYDGVGVARLFEKARELKKKGLGRKATGWKVEE